MSTVFVFILVIGFLIFVHELGHFLCARLFGIPVHEFAIGFPPRIFHKEIHGTTYSINALIFGGYVKIFEGERGEGGFTDAHPFKKIIVLLGGIFANICIALCCMIIAFMIPFDRMVTPSSAQGHDRIEMRVVDASASLSSLPEISLGDTLAEAPTVRDGVFVFDQDTLTLLKKEGEHIPFDWATLTKEEQDIFLQSFQAYAQTSLSFHHAVYQGARSLVIITESFFISMREMIRPQSSESSASLVGPIGIAGIVGDAARAGIQQLLFITALISLNLAYINLVPFPGLDGGRILIIIGETITRKPLPKTAHAVIHGIGFLVLIGLMIFITTKDIIRLF
ncbi:MAG: site-2 protease family protein [Candidatus Pacebacteria bacterium]|nr:site-2 protease family protein [Candidatus Paceibacterota bacterium]MCD8508293.1 site-2 protease family protein [Candidatus Paceibacterota bacterium]MCD8528355.1 site-2 protease family protein [Candidatus Paceibacterota bacterium]MCD8563986.1 site-2 protease family protein [Candidatus Paceibacterota bacterium]